MNKWKDGSRLTTVAILSFVAFLNVLYSNHVNDYFGRQLSINLGDGKCKWTAPVRSEISETNTTTLLASYPGSGKRLCWRILEALTGYVSGDDWDLSLEGFGTLFVKTSYPHPEGIWSWENKMDQVILIIRNPRYAIPSYHTMRYEIDFSDGWEKSFSHIDDTYTKRSPIEMWGAWRDERFNTEIDLWCWHIDFWMQDGMRRNDGAKHQYQDPHCEEEMVDCRPKAIIQFEKIVDPDEAVRDQELNKIASVLDASPNVTVIANEARPCVYEKVLERNEFYNPARNHNGPPTDDKIFTYQQVNAMRSQVSKMREKYSTPAYQNVAHARDLVVILDEYVAELSEEYVSSFRRENNNEN